MTDYEINGWESEEAQYKRFQVLYKEIRLSEHSLLDLGCGTGTLLKYLGDRRIKISYVGVDTNAEMIQTAKSRLQHGVFLNQDLFQDNPFPEESFDIVFASGIFNEDKGSNESLIQDTLALMEPLSAHYIVFNCLSSKAKHQQKGKFYINPQNIQYLIKKSGIRYLNYKVIENYLPDDFTVVIEKEGKFL